MKRLVMILLLVLLTLPRLLISDTLQGYEVILNKSVSIDPSEIESDYKVGYLSTSFKLNQLDVAYGYGYFEQWIKHRLPSAGYFEGNNQAMMTPSASQQMYFTAEGVGNNLKVKNEFYSVVDIVNLDAIDPNLDMIIDLPIGKMDVKSLYINQRISEQEVEQFLYSLNITDFTINDLNTLNNDLNAVMVVSEAVILIFTLLVLMKKKQMIDVILVMAVMLMRLPWYQLTFEILTDQLVSLKFYVDMIVNLPKLVYMFYVNNSLHVFLVKLGFIVLPVYYGLLIIFMKRGVNYEKNSCHSNGINHVFNSMWTECFSKRREA